MSNEKYPFRSEAEETDYKTHLAELGEARHLAEQNGPIASVSENLIAFRRRRSLKKVDVAKIMGVTARTYFAYESGQRSIPSDALILLAAETGADIHQLLMGRASANDADIVRAALIDASAIYEMLKEMHPEMNESTRTRVANACISTNWGDWPRVHPEVIGAAVLRCTNHAPQYSELPTPPDFRDYRGDFQRYETDLNDWEKLAKEY